MRFRAPLVSFSRSRGARLSLDGPRAGKVPIADDDMSRRGRFSEYAIVLIMVLGAIIDGRLV